MLINEYFLLIQIGDQINVDICSYLQQAKITEMLAANGRRLIVNINDLRIKNPRRANELVSNSAEEMMAFELALKSIVLQADPSLQKQYRALRFSVGLEGSFGSKHVTPRSLTSEYLGGVVCLEGELLLLNSILNSRNEYIFAQNHG